MLPTPLLPIRTTHCVEGGPMIWRTSGSFAPTPGPDGSGNRLSRVYRLTCGLLWRPSDQLQDRSTCPGYPGCPCCHSGSALAVPAVLALHTVRAANDLS